MRKFLDAYIELANAVQEAGKGSYDLGMDSALDLLPPDSFRLIDKTAEAAGRAHPAVAASGFNMQLFGQVFNPIIDWQRSFIGAGVEPKTVISFARQLIGMYEQRASEARQRERGITGVVGRFVRFPSDVREAAGLSSKVGKKSAFLVGLMVQVMGTVLAAGILALITYGASRLLP